MAWKPYEVGRPRDYWNGEICLLFQFSETLPEQGLTLLNLNGRDWHRGAVLLSQSHARHGVLAVY